MIHKTQLSVVNKQNIELGIDDNTDHWQEYNLILTHVTAYKPFYNDDDEPEPDRTVVYDLGGSSIIKTSYSFFDKLMHEFYKG